MLQCALCHASLPCSFLLSASDTDGSPDGSPDPSVSPLWMFIAIPAHEHSFVTSCSRRCTHLYLLYYSSNHNHRDWEHFSLFEFIMMRLTPRVGSLRRNSSLRGQYHSISRGLRALARCSHLTTHASVYSPRSLVLYRSFSIDDKAPKVDPSVTVGGKGDSASSQSASEGSKGPTVEELASLKSKSARNREIDENLLLQHTDLMSRDVLQVYVYDGEHTFFFLVSPITMIIRMVVIITTIIFMNILTSASAFSASCSFYSYTPHFPPSISISLPSISHYTLL